MLLLMNRADTAHLAGSEGGVGHLINFPVHSLVFALKWKGARAGKGQNPGWLTVVWWAAVSEGSSSA